MKQVNNSRRKFVKQTAIGTAGLFAGLPARSYARIIGANERIQVAMLGCNRRFRGLSESISKLELVDIAYVCDVDTRRQDKAIARVEELTGSQPTGEKDLRKIVERPEIDAVFNATPDHWHLHASWMAMENGKHVYVEKPCSHNCRESEVLVALQKKYNKVVQMGNQQRSAPESREIIEEIHKGIIGRAYAATAFYNNSRGPVPKAQKVAVPIWLDWELFQGPAQRMDYFDILGDYNWHWYWNYGTAETGNNATHELDIARWALQVRYPKMAWVNAAKQHYTDDAWTMYDTMEANFLFPGDKSIRWDGKSRNAYKTYSQGRGTIIYGTEGSVYVDRGGYQLYDRKGELIRERKGGGDEAGLALGGGGGMTTLHVQNFLNTIRGKDQLNSPIVEGAISTQLCHYANISYQAGKMPLQIDPENGRLKNKKYRKKYWGRKYHKGWELPKL